MKARKYLSTLLLIIAFVILRGNSATASDIDAFLQSVKRGDYAEVKRIIEAGTDVNAKDNEGWTALMWASQEGHKEVVKLLIEAGADVNVRGKKGWTALMLAAEGGHTETAQLLIEAGAKE